MDLKNLNPEELIIQYLVAKERGDEEEVQLYYKDDIKDIRDRIDDLLGLNAQGAYSFLFYIDYRNNELGIENDRALGMSVWATIGRELDVNALEAMDYFEKELETLKELREIVFENRGHLNSFDDVVSFLVRFIDNVALQKKRQELRDCLLRTVDFIKNKKK